MPGAAATKDSTCTPETVSITTDLFQEEETGKKLQVHCPSVLSPESPAKLYGCYAVIAVLTAAVIALTVTLSGYDVFSPYTQEAQPGRLLQALDKCSPHEIQARQDSVSKHKIQRRKKKAVPRNPTGRLWIGDPHTRRGLLMITYESTVQEHTSLRAQTWKCFFIIFHGTICISVRPVNETRGPCYATCPRDWVGFGSKCFYFSEDTRNWTFSQTSCMAQKVHLARFDSLEELNFLKRCKGDSDHWMDLYRESPEHSWRWTNNTEYNNLVPIRGQGECVYLSGNGISSGRGYTYRKWICSKPQLSFTRANDF